MATTSWFEDNGYQAPAGADVYDPSQGGGFAGFPPASNTGTFISNDPAGGGIPSSGYTTVPDTGKNTGAVPPWFLGNAGNQGGQPSIGPLPAPKGNDPAQIEAWFASMGVSDPKYYTQKALQADPSGVGSGEYWANRVKSDMAGGGGGGPVGFGSFLTPFSGSFEGTGPVPQWNQPFTDKFQAPTGLTYENDPGYQARMQMGTDAIQNSAAAKGTLLTGGTLKDLAKFGQDYGSNEFGNVFNRALQGYNTALQGYNANLQGYDASLRGNQQQYGQAANTFGTNYDIFRNNQNDPYSKLFGVTQLGLNAAGNASGALGQNASAYGNVLTGQGTNAANTQIGMGNVGAAGTVGQYNAYGQAIPGVATSLADWYQQRRQPRPPLPVTGGIPGTGYSTPPYVSNGPIS